MDAVTGIRKMRLYSDGASADVGGNKPCAACLVLENLLWGIAAKSSAFSVYSYLR